MTACDEVASLLALEGAVALAPELLDADERATLLAHLAGCAACGVRRQAFAGAVTALAEPPSAGAVPAGFEAVLARLAAGEDPAQAEAKEAREAKSPQEALPGDEGALPAPAVRLVIALACTYCRDGLLRAEATYCASCLAPHHGECLQAHGRCAAPGCEETRVVRPLDAQARPARPRRGQLVAFLLGGGLVAALGVAALRSAPGLAPSGPAGAPQIGAVASDHPRPPSVAELLERAGRLMAEPQRSPERRRRALIEARETLARAVELAPDEPRGWLLTGRARAELQDLGGALAALDRAVALAPRSAEALLARSEVRRALGDAERALVDEVRARELEVRVVQGEVVKVEGPGRTFVRAPAGADGLRLGDALAIRRGGRLAIRLKVVELIGEVGQGPAGQLARCEAESLVPGATPEAQDVAVLVTEASVWAEAADRVRRARLLESIERKREPGGLRVLYVEATAGRSWAATRDALLRSRAIEARTWLVSDDPTLVQRASEGVTPLTALPASFGEFHVVLVSGDVPPALLPEAALVRFVQNGGGLVLLPGADGFVRLPGALGSDLPVVSGPPEAERPARRVSFGQGLLRLPQLLGAPAATIDLPQLFGVHTRTATRGAQVLALDEQGRPLVALGSVVGGDGRIVQVGADDLWRWETAEGGKELLQLFWLEVVAAASGEVEPGSRR